MQWTERRTKAVLNAMKLHGLRVVCLVCGREQRHYPGARRLRDAACENPLCGEKALRSRYWIQTHPELASEARRRALSLARTLRG